MALQIVSMKIILVLSLYGVTAQEFIFPTDDGTSEAQSYINKVSIQDRSSPVYKHYVEKVIADGITTLTLAINRVAPFISEELRNADNLVYGPVSISGIITKLIKSSELQKKIK